MSHRRLGLQRQVLCCRSISSPNILILSCCIIFFNSVSSSTSWSFWFTSSTTSKLSVTCVINLCVAHCFLERFGLVKGGLLGVSDWLMNMILTGVSQYSTVRTLFVPKYVYFARTDDWCSLTSPKAPLHFSFSLAWELTTDMNINERRRYNTRSKPESSNRSQLTSKNIFVKFHLKIKVLSQKVGLGTSLYLWSWPSLAQKKRRWIRTHVN